MDELHCFRVFIKVAELKSFYATARHFGTSTATVSKQIAALERAMNAQLLTRSSRQVMLTAAGRQVAEKALSVVEQVDELKATIGASSNPHSGTLRIGVSPMFGTKRLLPAVLDYNREFPGVRIELSLLLAHIKDSELVEALDVLIVQAVELKDSSLVAIPLGREPQVLVASPQYLRRHPELHTPSDLARCNCLVNRLKSPTDHWTFESQGQQYSVKVHGALTSDMANILHEAALSGAGLSVHPVYMVQEDIDRGRLEVVLPQFQPPPLNAYALFPTQKNLPARTRSFLDFLSRKFDERRAAGVGAGSQLPTGKA